MILASVHSSRANCGLDGELVVVSSDRTRIARLAENRLSTLRHALDEWTAAEPYLRSVQKDLDLGVWRTIESIEAVRFRAPLPRAGAFLDGSAFVQHVLLVRKARGVEPPEDLLRVPLMYQGASDNLLGPEDPIPLYDEKHGMDFESEVAIVTDFVPARTKARHAAAHVKLLVVLNDISLRELIPRELATGFGFFHGKPPSSFAPFAVTPEELGSHFRDGRVHLPLTTLLNGEVFGTPNAGEMHFSFYDLIEYAAFTRPLSAATIIGSGTVSNKDSSVGSSCLVERRMIEKIETGSISTPYLKDGDRITIQMKDGDRDIFGTINQKVVQA